MEDIVDFVMHCNAFVLDLWRFPVEGLVRYQGTKFLAAKHNQVVNCNHHLVCSRRHLASEPSLAARFARPPLKRGFRLWGIERTNFWILMMIFWLSPYLLSLSPLLFLAHNIMLVLWRNGIAFDQSLWKRYLPPSNRIWMTPHSVQRSTNSQLRNPITITQQSKWSECNSQ